MSFSFPVAEEADRAGNAIRYSYGPPLGPNGQDFDGEYDPTRIDYTFQTHRLSSLPRSRSRWLPRYSSCSTMAGIEEAGSPPRAARAERLASASLVALGIAVRGVLFAIQPTPMLWFDTGMYMRESLPDVAPAALHPLGYSWFLAGLRRLSGELWPIQAAQMLLGVAAAICLCDVARRLMPRPRWASLAVLGACLLWPTNLILESYALSETLFLFVVSLGACLLVRSTERRSPAGMALAGLALGFSALVRVPGLYFCLTFAGASLLLLIRGAAPDSRPRPWVNLWGPAAFGLPCAVVLLAYMEHYHQYYGAWAIESWAGIDRYCLVAPLIEPELAEPDARSVAFLRAHAEGNRGSFSSVMWSKDSPITRAPEELGLDPPALDRWAGTLARRAAARHPLEVARIFAHNLGLELTAKDPLEQQIEVKPRLAVHGATLEIYHVDPSAWHTNHAFRAPWLLWLEAWKPVLFCALVAGLLLSLRPGCRHVYQVIVTANALGFMLAIAASIEPEQRHLHVVENLSILSAALLGGHLQLTAPAWLPRILARALAPRIRRR